MAEVCSPDEVPRRKSDQDKKPLVNSDGRPVGYKNTPEKTRWPKGRSGNPKGRPKKKPKTIDEQFHKEMMRETTINQGGKKVKLPPQVLIYRMHIRKAAEGSVQSARVAMQMEEKYGPNLELLKRPTWQIEAEQAEADLEKIRNRLSQLIDEETEAAAEQTQQGLINDIASGKITMDDITKMAIDDIPGHGLDQ